MADDNTFGLSNINGSTISPEPLNGSQPANPSTLVTSTSSSSAEPLDPQMTDIDKELEKQLESIPAGDSSKKFPVKIVAIITLVLAIGGAAAYFFLGTSNPETAVATPDGPPSITNPFASTDTASDTPSTDVTDAKATTPEVSAETDAAPDSPPSISFPTPDAATSEPPATDTSADATELKDTVNTLKVTSDAAANLTVTPTMEDSATPAETPKKISR